ncbi:MAG: hypothetical protein WD118_05980 [Phycisphaeraceae bacterium]
MTLHLTEPLHHLLRPLFKALPLERAMEHLVVAADQPTSPHVALVEEIVSHDALAEQPELVAGLWLYVDDLDRSHAASQQIDTPTGSFWHAIMHRREGDFSNSKYWFRRTGKHPVMSRITTAGGSAGAGTTIGEYEPFTFVDRVQRAYDKGENVDWPELVAMQRREWRALFEWCVEH